MVRLRNKIKGKQWLVDNAKKANLASQVAKKARKTAETAVHNSA